MGNSQHGVTIFDGAHDNVIGGIGIARNVISANGYGSLAYNGIYLQESSTRGNRIQGNYIGTDATGAQNRGNAANGIHLNGATNTVIQDNVISANRGSGIFGGGTETAIVGNKIGVAVDGMSPLGNALDGSEHNRTK